MESVSEGDMSKNYSIYWEKKKIMGLTMYLLIIFSISTLGLIISIITKNKLAAIILGIIDIIIISFTLFLIFILIPAM